MLDREIRSYDIAAITFARAFGGSQERRCLWELCGKSMLQWSFEAVRNSKYIKKIVLGTEDLKIARFAEDLGVTVVMRPLEDALDFPRDYTSGMHKRIKPRSLTHSKPISWLGRYQYILYCLKEERGYIPDLFFAWSPDMPLATTETADEVIEAFFKDEEASIALSVCSANPKLLTINPVTQRLFPLFIDGFQGIDRQLYPPTFKWGPFSLRGLPLVGRGKMAHIVAKEEEGVSVHSKGDLDYASYLMEKKLKGGEKK